MSEITTIGLDIAKRVFQVHGVDGSGRAVLRRQLRRHQLVGFFAKLPACLVGLEACGTAHHWARQLARLGHQVRLIPPAYAKAYVRRNKTDAADAAAICEAVSRPAMRFVPIKSEAEQAVAAVHRVRERLIGQRTMVSNALRAQLSEFGIVAAKGPAHLGELLGRLDEVPAMQPALRGLVHVLEGLQGEIAALEGHLLAWHRASELSRRLASIPGLGPITSSALAARVLQPQRFARGRDFAAWLGLVPRQSASGGKIRLGAISKRGDGYLRRLLVNGAQALLTSKRVRADPWVARLLATKPRLVAAVALANKLARIAWAVMVGNTAFAIA